DSVDDVGGKNGGCGQGRGRRPPSPAATASSAKPPDRASLSPHQRTRSESLASALVSLAALDRRSAALSSMSRMRRTLEVMACRLPAQAWSYEFTQRKIGRLAALTPRPVHPQGHG